jgi:glutamine synthetase
VAAANEIGELITTLRERRSALESLIGKADHLHDDAPKQAKLLTGAVADAMAAARETCDALELKVADELWPLPKYREMLFPV